MSDHTCSIEGCERTVQARQFCGAHYKRWRLYGDPLILRQHYRSNPADFWVQVAVGAPGQCWPWLRSRNSQGYGGCSYQGATWKSHRLAWTLTNGLIPDGLCVCHSCDTPPCCNPAHLFLGTNAENISDREGKGRGVRLVGRAHGMSKLTEVDVLELRRLHATGVSQRELASRYGVTPTNVGYIIRRETWAHV